MLVSLFLFVYHSININAGFVIKNVMMNDKNLVWLLFGESRIFTKFLFTTELFLHLMHH